MGRTGQLKLELPEGGDLDGGHEGVLRRGHATNTRDKRRVR